MSTNSQSIEFRHYLAYGQKQGWVHYPGVKEMPAMPREPKRKTPAANKTKPMITETVTLSFEVELDYQNDAGRAWLVKTLKRDARVYMRGAGVDTGLYGMKSIEGSARVLPNDSHP